MRSIFFKLFISFALTVFLSGIVSSIVTYSFSHKSIEGFRNDFHEKLKKNIAHSTILIGEAAYVIYEKRGATALEEYLEKIKIPLRTEIFLLIDQAVIPEHQSLPEEAQKMAMQARLDGSLHLTEHNGELITAKQYTTPEKKSYVVVGLHKIGPPPEFGERKPPQGPPGIKPLSLMAGRKGPPPANDLMVQIVILILIAGLVCYGLARSFSAPINRLRKASQRIASGDLSTRVGEIPGRKGNELADLGRDFDDMAERMEKLVESQKRLLVDISHELRSPLARINVALELAKKEYKAQTGGMLDRIEKESDQLNSLIGQLLTHARIENSEENFIKKPVEIKALLRDIAEDISFEVQGASKGVVITTVEDITVEASRELLRLGIENIARNAAYYTAEGTNVEISARVIRQNETEQLLIQVQDHGPGIPDNELQAVMQPFYRVSGSRSRRSGGVGIGLAIAKQAIEHHGGSISIANKTINTGLEVKIFIPISDRE